MEKKVVIIGLGYVGLPLAVEFGKKIETIGFDINEKRIQELKKFKDINLDLTKKQLIKSKKLKFTSDLNQIKSKDFYIISTPTPIKKNKKPDLKYLIDATKEVSKVMKKNSIIIYESTVYPGVTENICGSLIKKLKGFVLNKDFYLGYSPERINPGDKNHTLKKIKKVISGSNKKALDEIEKLYSLILNKNLFKAKTIKVAEAAKVIENTQRDINIALMNELSKIFLKLNINTQDVLDAAKTKWNFGDYSPGLVGGHCIGVDPYYLTYKSMTSGYNPKVILSGRKINDGMPRYIFNNILKLCSKKKIRRKKILFLGLTFKENCPDIRNSKAFELCELLASKFNNIKVYDPFIKKLDSVNKKIDLLKKFPTKKFDIIIIAVKHEYFKKIGLLKFQKLLNKKNLFIDIKNCFKNNQSDFSL